MVPAPAAEVTEFLESPDPCGHPAAGGSKSFAGAAPAGPRTRSGNAGRNGGHAGHAHRVPAPDASGARGSRRRRRSRQRPGPPHAPYGHRLGGPVDPIGHQWQRFPGFRRRRRHGAREGFVGARIRGAGQDRGHHPTGPVVLPPAPAVDHDEHTLSPGFIERIGQDREPVEEGRRTYSAWTPPRSRPGSRPSASRTDRRFQTERRSVPAARRTTPGPTHLDRRRAGQARRLGPPPEDRPAARPPGPNRPGRGRRAVQYGHRGRPPGHSARGREGAEAVPRQATGRVDRRAPARPPADGDRRPRRGRGDRNPGVEAGDGHPREHPRDGPRRPAGPRPRSPASGGRSG
jgi:hypothetical protein